jgi:hypothetical protein
MPLSLAMLISYQDRKHFDERRQGSFRVFVFSWQIR